MKTYLQKKLTGLHGQMVVFDQNGQAVPGNLPDGIFPCLHVKLIRGEISGAITVTAVCGSHRVVKKAESGQNEVVLYLREYGLWKVDAAEATGTMIGTHREVRVDTVKEYWEIMGVEPQLGRNSPALIREACMRGEGEKLWSVGDELTLTLTDGRALTMQLCAFRHDTLTGGGKARVTFVTKNCLEQAAQDSTGGGNRNGWARGEIRDYLNRGVEPLLPVQWRTTIPAVRKLTASGGSSNRLEATEDKLFLLCAEEVSAQSGGNSKGEGSLYPLFTDNASRQKKDDRGAAAAWWLRSPAMGQSMNYCCVSEQGVVENKGAGLEKGLVFGFCL